MTLYGRSAINVSEEQKEYIQSKVKQGWTQDTLIGRKETAIHYSIRMFYRMFKKEIFGCTSLQLK